MARRVLALLLLAAVDLAAAAADEAKGGRKKPMTPGEKEKVRLPAPNSLACSSSKACHAPSERRDGGAMRQRWVARTRVPAAAGRRRSVAAHPAELPPDACPPDRRRSPSLWRAPVPPNPSTASPPSWRANGWR